MNEKPILFSGEMVRKIQSGEKTQTRRIVKPQPTRMLQAASLGNGDWLLTSQTDEELARSECGEFYRLSGDFKVGDRLWVRETFQLCEWFQDHWEPAKLRPEAQTIQKFYAADQALPDQEGLGWRPSIYMPRWASRITLEITDVRVERLQDISEKDAKAEGVSRSETVRGHKVYHASYRAAFSSLWNSIYDPRSWESNPWLWAITFKKL